MNEKLTFYENTSYKKSDFRKYNLKGQILLILAEKKAKESASNHTTIFIHRHILEVRKTFKVTDTPKETTPSANICEFEKCEKPKHTDRNNNWRDFCSLHTAVQWRNEIGSKNNKKLDFTPPIKKIPQKLGLNLLEMLVEAGRSWSSYGGNEQRAAGIITEIRGLFLPLSAISHIL